MFELFVLLIAISVPAWAISRHVRLNQARVRANRIIGGDEAATEEQINQIIDRIQTTKNWLQDMTEQDRLRVSRLRDMRNEMVTPRG